MSNYPTRKSFKSLLRDRPKHSGKIQAHTLVPRKGGAGKGNVGRPGDEINQPNHLDRADPNYASDADDDESLYYLPLSQQLQPSSSTAQSFTGSIADYNRFKVVVRKAAAEYIVSHDQIEFVTTVDELHLPLFTQDVPYIVIKYSFDRSDSDRNSLSSLLLHATKPAPSSTLATPSPLLTPQHFAHSFLKLCYSLTDLTLDAPNARLYIREYAQFFVAAGVLDPKVWQQCETYEQVIGNDTEIRTLKHKIADIVTDLFVNEEIDDAIESIQSLPNVDSLGYEVIKAIVRAALDRNNRQRELTSRFLAYTSQSLFSQPSIERAFSVMLERVEDLYLDVPDILHLLSVFIARAVVDECLSPAFLARVDVDDRDLGAQVLRQVSRLLEGEGKWERMERCWKGERGAQSGDTTPDRSRGSSLDGEVGRRRSPGGGGAAMIERKEGDGEELKE